MKLKYIIALILLLVISINNAVDESSESSTSPPSCIGANLELLPMTSDIKKCAQYKEIIQIHLDRTGLSSKGFDVLTIMGLIQTESSCDPKTSGGLMRVQNNRGEYIKYEPTDIDSQIKGGMDILKEKYKNVYSDELSQNDIFTLTLFDYNRGVGEKAKQKVLEKMDIFSAMVEACKKRYTSKDKNSQYYPYDLDGKDKCTFERYGANYPKRIIEKAQKGCQDSSGTWTSTLRAPLETDIAEELEDIKVYSAGTYYVDPSFTVEVDYEFNDYEELIKKANEMTSSLTKTDLTNLYKKNKEKINDQLTLTTNSCIPEEKFLEILQEEFDHCMGSIPERDCYCELDMSTLMESETYVATLQTTDKTILTDGDNKFPKPLNYKIGIAEEIQGQKVTHGNFEDEFGIVASYKDKQLQNLNLNVKAAVKKLDKTLQFFKKDNSRLFIIPKELADAHTDVKKNKCRYEKRIFRFCAESQQKVLAHDFETKKTGLLPVQYKFALYFDDKEAPEPISNLQVTQDASEKKVTINFDPSLSRDIKKYWIYCVEEDLFGGNPSSDTVDEKRRSMIYEPKEKINERTEIKTKLCNKDEFVSGKTYFFAVTPVDMSGNENKEFPKLQYIGKRIS